MIASLRGLFCLALLAFAVVVGCSNDPFDPDSLPNTPPVARIFVGGELQGTSYNQATFHWSGSDKDGLVVGFYVGISLDENPPLEWIFTTGDDTTATYSTDDEGRVAPTLYVVALDNREALSDTVVVTFPLVNFPPAIEFIRDFEPLQQSFGAASFEFLGFDLDGDETLQPFVDYRYAGSDPNNILDEEDPAADPAVAWVRTARPPTRFSLGLRNIPPGDPDDEFRQTLYVRVFDEAGSSAVFEYEWQVFEVRGSVLLIDDNLTQLARDAFYRDALAAHLGDEFSVWDISPGLPARAEDLWLTLSQFSTLVWYTSSSASENLREAQAVLQRYITEDIDPATVGVQWGHLLLENQSLVGTASNLSSNFRTNVLGISATTDPRNSLERYDIARNTIGSLQINAQDASIPDLESVGLNYFGDAGIYFGLSGMLPQGDAAALWRFESHKWGGAADPTCRLGCEPIVAIRKPANEPPRVISLGFQLDYANSLGNAIEAVGDLLTLLGVEAVGP